MMASAIKWAAGLLVAWIALSSIVFQIRHPWMTDLEVMLRLPDAMMFRSVDYWDVRPRP